MIKKIGIYLFAALVAVSIFPVNAFATSRIFFSSRRTGSFEIYSANWSTGSQKRLTKNSVIDMCPAVSPDGSKVAFISKRTSKPEIWVMNANGTNQKKLSNLPGLWGAGFYSNTYKYSIVQWSPDGSRIAFSTYNVEGHRPYDNAVFVMKSNGSGLRRTDLPSGFKYVGTTGTFSWLGNFKIVYELVGWGGAPPNAIAVSDKNGRNVRVIKKLSWNYPLTALAGSRTGNYVAYSDGTLLYRITASGSNLSKMGMFLGLDAISWAPYDRYLAVSYGQGDYVGTFFVTLVKNSNRRKVWTISAADNPCICKDGSKVAFRKLSGAIAHPKYNVAWVPLSGHGVRVLTTTGKEYWPNWQ